MTEPKQDTIFYAWQSDLPNSTNRGFIEDCLARTIKEMEREGDLEVLPSVDRDTQNVAGAVNISDTIFEKIDKCRIFVCDVSLINRPQKKVAADAHQQRPTPNPNVLIEAGYAAKACTWERVIFVFNKDTGPIEALPFDIRGRKVLTYELAPNQDKSSQRALLVRLLKNAIGDILSVPEMSRHPIRLEFYDPVEKQLLGTRFEINGALYSSNLERLPDYRDLPDAIDSIGLQQMLDPSRERTNKDYFRDKASYILTTELTKCVSLSAYNSGDVTLTDVWLEVSLDRPKHVVIEDIDMPFPPLRTSSFMSKSILSPRVQMRRNLRSPGVVIVEEFDDKYDLTVHFGKIQPKTSAYSDPFFIGCLESCECTLQTQLHADELPHPQIAILQLDFQTDVRGELSLEMLQRPLPEEEG
ncbi:MAG: hypothetical protein KDB27_02150 [Planctomycetales bacterium]|nr:hypothetical protein [Planctomycetales bacterium]